jgi:hypothetical protein
MGGETCIVTNLPEEFPSVAHKLIMGLEIRVQNKKRRVDVAYKVCQKSLF